PREISLKDDLIAFFKLFFLLHKERYDVVHTYTATPGFLGRLSAFFTRIPAIFHHQAGWTVTEYSTLKEKLIYYPLETLAVFLSTKSICVSHAVRKQANRFKLMPSKKLVTICNGIDPTPFLRPPTNDIRAELNVPKDCILIGNTGRLARQKDNISLVRAMPILMKLLPNKNIQLLLIGDGPERPKIIELIQKANLQNVVKLLGFRKDIPNILANIDVFVSPSLWEGLSISIMEAMAAAKPIVATNILPNKELIKHEETGLVVDPDSPEQIAEAIFRFIQSPELAQKCGQSARKLLLKDYTIDRMFQETWNLYEDALKKRG
ncbi:MAG: glycosyltransferase family 4 protein, partial [Candidatus Helarchaeota archaeon]